MYNDNTYCSDKHRQTHMHNYLYSNSTNNLLFKNNTKQKFSIIIIHITEFLFSINLIKNCFIM